MKRIVFAFVITAVLLFSGCELFLPTVLVSGSVYTENYSSATLGQVLEPSNIYPVVVTSETEGDLGGSVVADLDLSALLPYISATGGIYSSPLLMTSTGNDDYGPVEVSMSGSSWYRVLFVEDVDGDGSVTSADAIVGASSVSLNVYSSGEETGTDSVYFSWDLVVDN